MDLTRKLTWELKNMVKALSLHPWLNTVEEQERLRDAKIELKNRERKRKLEML